MYEGKKKCAANEQPSQITETEETADSSFLQNSATHRKSIYLDIQVRSKIYIFVFQMNDFLFYRPKGGLWVYLCAR